MTSDNMLMLPYGKTDFGAIRREGYYYVDKTRFIRQLEREGIFVFFLRPRRFGKSLMLAVLQAYYDVKYRDQFDILFGGLDIYRNPTSKHNTYLVLKFNFSGVDSDPENVLESFNKDVLFSLQSFVHRYEDLLPAGTSEQLVTYTHSDEAMKYIMEQTQRSGHLIYLMIDEYDNFANTLMSENEDDYRTITHGIGQFRLFFNILKLATTGMDSPIDRMFITGVSPLTLSDVTGGFNIGDNFSLLADYNEMVGFTEDEVRKMLEYYRDKTGVFKHTVDELLEMMRPWYDNNCFSADRIGEQHMFNSGMTLYFLKQYLARKGGIPYAMIDMNIRSDYNKMRRMVRMEKTFGEKGQIIQRIFEDRSTPGILIPEFSIEDLLVAENLTSHLFYMGLLTYGFDKYGRPGFIIPNLVVYEQYYRYMADCYERCLSWHTDTNTINHLAYKMIDDGNALPLLEYICQQVTAHSSVRDFDPQAEAFVKGFLLSKLGGTNNAYFVITTEREENHGYSDLYMEPWNGLCRHCFLIELKYCKHGALDSEVEARRQDAIKQLQRYTEDKALQQKVERMNWTLHKIAIVYRGWMCELVEELPI